MEREAAEAGSSSADPPLAAAGEGAEEQPMTDVEPEAATDESREGASPDEMQQQQQQEQPQPQLRPHGLFSRPQQQSASYEEHKQADPVPASLAGAAAASSSRAAPLPAGVAGYAYTGSSRGPRAPAPSDDGFFTRLNPTQQVNWMDTPMTLTAAVKHSVGQIRHTADTQEDRVRHTQHNTTHTNATQRETQREQSQANQWQATGVEWRSESDVDRSALWRCPAALVCCFVCALPSRVCVFVRLPFRLDRFKRLRERRRSSPSNWTRSRVNRSDAQSTPSKQLLAGADIEGTLFPCSRCRSLCSLHLTLCAPLVVCVGLVV